MRRIPVGRPRKNKVYFDQAVQDAIVEYNQSENPLLRDKIYREKIHFALDKLCENIINTFKFSYFDAGFNDVKQEVLSFLVMNMHKYKPDTGFKAFSYFSVVAKNYLIAVNNGNYKKLTTHSEISRPSISAQLVDIPRHEKEVKKEFMDMITKYFDKKIPSLFRKKRDIDIAYSIVELFNRRGEIDNFNKKSLYILIREMTGVNTVYITKVVNEMKKHYKILALEYQTGVTSPSK